MKKSQLFLFNASRLFKCLYGYRIFLVVLKITVFGDISPVVLWLFVFLTQAAAEKIVEQKASLCRGVIEGIVK